MAKLPKTIRQEHYKSTLSKIVETTPEVGLLKNKYRLMRFGLHQEWAKMLERMGENEQIDEFLKDVIYIDRKIRKLTENIDTENKKIAEQEYLLDEGYEVGVEKSINKLKTL